MYKSKSFKPKKTSDSGAHVLRACQSETDLKARKVSFNYVLHKIRSKSPEAVQCSRPPKAVSSGYCSNDDVNKSDDVPADYVNHTNDTAAATVPKGWKAVGGKHGIQIIYEQNSEHFL